MTTNSVPQSQPNHDKESQKEIRKTLKQAKKDPSVKEALKKEKQPVTSDDLSNLHNTHETGTSGGDQRASETELNQPPAPGETLPVKKQNRPKKWVP